MYLSELNLWNFRKYSEFKGAGADEISGKPGLSLHFNTGLNLLVGENDSGKTGIIDAIKTVILTQSREYLRLTIDDFFIEPGKPESERTKNLRIECVFRGFSDEEAGHFLDWLGIESNDGKNSYVLKVFIVAKRKGNFIYSDVKAGQDGEGVLLIGEAREHLRATYLKPLRDAENELTPGRKSRLSQILDSHESFKEKEAHYLLDIVDSANEKIEGYFKGVEKKEEEEVEIEDQSGKHLLSQINTHLKEFFGFENKKAKFSISELSLKGILEKLSLELSEVKSGLGSHNLLFIATELLLLHRPEYNGLKIALIEEIEAHLHPQAQLRLIEYLQEKEKQEKVQLILSTHSPNLASKVNLNNLILCKDNSVFPMGNLFTELEKGDYLFLERFLDVTKANLFFAKGVILVEGDAEALLIPAIAKILDRPLTKYGVSIVNVGSTAFLRYAKIFRRADVDKDEEIDIPVAVITDLDVKPSEYKEVDAASKTEDDINPDEETERKVALYDGQKVKTFICKHWTLEYDIACSSLSKLFYKAVLCAEKIKNSNEIGLNQKKLLQVWHKVKDDFEDWEAQWNDEPRKNRKIAFEIYNNKILKVGQLKSITAQCFSSLLERQNPEELKETIENDEYLKYLVDAIKYVTEE